MNKLALIKHVASEGGKLKRTIINAVAVNDPTAQITGAAVDQLFAELNEIVQAANVNESK
jgi:predicted metal-dependent peptidase